MLFIRRGFAVRVHMGGVMARKARSYGQGKVEDAKVVTVLDRCGYGIEANMGALCIWGGEFSNRPIGSPVLQSLTRALVISGRTTWLVSVLSKRTALSEYKSPGTTNTVSPPARPPRLLLGSSPASPLSEDPAAVHLPQLRGLSHGITSSLTLGAGYCCGGADRC